MATKICTFCFFLMVIVLPSRCAARSKQSKTVPQTVYDQKQTGDYNIQLHLKDFQIIALLGDDSIGGLGDYDYNYDYSDFTVKPVTQKPSDSTTPRPSRPPANSELSENPSTLKPSTDRPYPILIPSTTRPPKDTPLIIEEKPVISQDKPKKDTSNEVDKTEKPTTAGDENVELISSTSSKPEKNEESNSPGQIKVQIIETPVSVGGAVPGEGVHDQNNDAASHGEVTHQRRCGTGFARDKKGRCRRIRRPGIVSPQLPYGFSRLATNLASRLRYTSSDTSQSSSSSESTED